MIMIDTFTLSHARGKKSAQPAFLGNAERNVDGKSLELLQHCFALAFLFIHAQARKVKTD